GRGHCGRHVRRRRHRHLANLDAQRRIEDALIPRRRAVGLLAVNVILKFLGHVISKLSPTWRRSASQISQGDREIRSTARFLGFEPWRYVRQLRSQLATTTDANNQFSLARL